MSSQQDINLLRNFQRRLASFSNVTHLLERSHGGLGHFAILLARDGFFHRSNKVVCTGCGRETSLEDLRSLGEPFHNRVCHSVTQIEYDEMTYRQQFFDLPADDAAVTDGSPTGSLDDLRVRLKSDPDFIQLASRLNSFQGITWANIGQVNQLARHGLYYIGVGDTLRCFQCKLQFIDVSVNGVEGILQNHRQTSPSCTYGSATN